MERNYIAFISYRHVPRDIAVAKRLHSMIEQFRVPSALRENGKKRLGIVFRDQEELGAVSDLSAEIRNALDRSEYLIVVCSPEARESQWVCREIRYFLKNHSRSRLLAVLASGEPAEAFPEPLFRDESGEDAWEPLAVDIRGSSTSQILSNLGRERLRLFSGLLRCPYDSLVQRENRRRATRLISFFGGVLAVAALFTSTLLLKNTQIRSINRELDLRAQELLRSGQQLQQSNQEALLRESMLLTGEAEELLASGDIVGAIRSAVAALPGSGSSDRPYYPEAEKVLLEAMSVFELTPVRSGLSDTTLRQLTEVTDFVMTENGERLVAIDRYGMTSCFDCNDGTLLWQEDFQAWEQLISGINTVFLCDGEQIALRVFSDCIRAYRLEDGTLLWSHSCETAAYGDNIFYHAPTDTLVHLESSYTDYFSRSTCIQVLDVKTGDVLSSIPITQPVNSSCRFSEYENPHVPPKVFSDDGRLFVLSFSEQVMDTTTSQVTFLLADLEEGTCRTVYRETVDDYYANQISAIALSDDGSTLLRVRLDHRDADGAWIDLLDLTRGEALWRISTPRQTRDVILSYEHCFLLEAKGIYLVSVADSLYCLGSDGTLLDSRILSDRLTCLQWVNSNWFGIGIADGTYAIGKIAGNKLLLTTDPFWHCIARLSDNSLMRVWNEGIIQYFSDGHSLQLGMENLLGPGFVAYVPEEAPCSIVISRILQQEQGNPWLSLEDCPTFQAASPIHTFPVDQQTLIAGPFRTGLMSDDLYLVFDMAQHRVLDIRTPGADMLNDVFFFRDGESGGYGYIESSESGDILLHQNGKTVELSVSDFTAYKRGEDADSSFTASTYLSSGQVLSVRLDEQELRCWVNGRETQHVPLPEVFRELDETGYLVGYELLLTSDGHVFAAPYGNREENLARVSRSAVFNISTGEWVLLSGEDALLTNNYAVAVNEQAGELLLCDIGGNLRRYCLETGSFLGSIPLGLPCLSIGKMMVLPGGEKLLIQTQEDNCYIFDLSTGMYILETTVSYRYDAVLTAFTDTVNNRLYILNSGHTYSDRGLCINLSDWSLLSNQVDGFWFDTERSQLYCYEQDYPLLYTTIPDTNSLIQMGEAILAAADAF